MKTNKEVVEKLVEYFLTQDQASVCRILANLMIDMHRINNISKLEEKEKASLFFRMDKNSKSLLDFVKNGPQGDLTVFNNEAT